MYIIETCSEGQEVKRCEICKSVRLFYSRWQNKVICHCLGCDDEWESSENHTTDEKLEPLGSTSEISEIKSTGKPIFYVGPYHPHT